MAHWEYKTQTTGRDMLLAFIVAIAAVCMAGVVLTLTAKLCVILWRST